MYDKNTNEDVFKITGLYPLSFRLKCFRLRWAQNACILHLSILAGEKQDALEGHGLDTKMP